MPRRSTAKAGRHEVPSAQRSGPAVAGPPQRRLRRLSIPRAQFSKVVGLLCTARAGRFLAVYVLGVRLGRFCHFVPGAARVAVTVVIFHKPAYFCPVNPLLSPVIRNQPTRLSFMRSIHSLSICRLSDRITPRMRRDTAMFEKTRRFSARTSSLRAITCSRLGGTSK